MEVTKQTLDRFWDKVDKSGSCWFFRNGAVRQDYGVFRLDGKNIKSHIASWIIHYGPVPDGLCVCHKCDNRSCVKPDHLFIGTQSDNIKDAVAKGRITVPHVGNTKRGTSRNNTKLNDVSVRKIRERFKTHTGSYEELGQNFGVSAGTIWNIIHRKTWKHVD